MSDAIEQVSSPSLDLTRKRHHVSCKLAENSLWKSQFGSDPKILGRTLTLDADRYTVIGVMPLSFHYPAGNDVWIPFNLQDPRLSQRGNHGIRVLGRVKPGVTLAQARQDLLNISLQLEKEYPDQNKNVHAVLIPLKEQRSDLFCSSPASPSPTCFSHGPPDVSVKSPCAPAWAQAAPV